MNASISVPRVCEVTKSRSADEKYAELEWSRKRKLFLADKNKFQFGSKESREAWKRRIRQTRSF